MPWTRFVDAAEVFAPQKGATRAQVGLLRRRLERLGAVYADEHGVDVVNLERSGAAGGLAGGLAAAGATLEDGFTLIAEAVDLYGAIESADLVVTGEGRLGPSFEGKVVGGVASLAAAAGVDAVAIVGRADGIYSPIPVVDLRARFGEERAMTDTLGCITDAARGLLGSA